MAEAGRAAAGSKQNWSWPGAAWRVLPVVTNPLLVLALVGIVFPLLAYQVPSLFGGLFAFEDVLQCFAVGLAANLATAVAVTCWNVALYYGAARFDLPEAVEFRERTRLPIYLAGVAAAEICVVVGGWEANLDCRWMLGLGAVTGLLVSTGLQIGASWLQAWATNNRDVQEPMPYFSIPLDRILFASRLAGKIQQQHERDTAERWRRIQESVDGSVGALAAYLGEGYTVAGAGPPRLASGHYYALFFSAIFGVFYLGVAVFAGPSSSFQWPALAWLLLALTLGAWVLSGLAFFLQRWRRSAGLAVAVFAVFGGWVLPQLMQLAASGLVFDQIYRVEESSATLPSPGEILRRKGDLPVLVATAGGGIQAAAWTVRVLTGLEDELRGLDPYRTFSRNRTFSRSVAAISGVSGGSVGGLFYTAALLEKKDSTIVNSMVRENSLDQIAWGWFTADLASDMLPLRPLFRYQSRGAALEETWSRRIWPRGNVPRLADWGAQANSDAGIPALLLNSTEGDTGKPLVFSTTSLRGKPGTGFWEEYGKQLQVSMSTAARMSASFPYVTPASAAHLPNCAEPCPALPQGKRYHLVDGGYYNNYGLITAMEWFDEAVDELDDEGRRRARQVVLLRIESFPPPHERVAKGMGFLYQLGAPLLTLLNVRDQAQRDPSDTFIEQFRQRMRSKGIGLLDVEIGYPDPKAVQRPECSPPLSWKLTEPQKKCIDGLWEKVRTSDAVKSLKEAWTQSLP